MEQFTFEIDWDYGQQRGMYDLVDDPEAEEYYNETDEEEAEVAEEEVDEPEAVPAEKPAQGKQKDKAPAKTEEIVPEAKEKKETKGSKGKSKAKGKGKGSGKKKTARKEPKVTRIPRARKKAVEDDDENSEDDIESEENEISESNVSESSDNYSESESGSGSESNSGSESDNYSAKPRMPKPYYQNNPFGFSPENFSPKELKNKLMERKDPDNEKAPHKPWWSDEQFPPKPLLNLSVSDPLVDLKQDDNKGEDANLHLIHEFENEEIERAKEYEQRAQLWD